MADTLESFDEAIKRANEAYAAAISTLSKAVQTMPGTAPPGREPLVENVVRLGRMNKDALIAAIEQTFELWEGQVRRLSAGAGRESDRAAEGPSTHASRSNPIEIWAENWRKTTDAFLSGTANEELRKQAETVQNAFVRGIQAWQRLWESPKR
jgi:hypothetical protein